jgi:hypothetical protein
LRLKQRVQHADEPLLTYYDDITELCQQVDPQMPLYMIVDYLLDGVRSDLKLHIKRRFHILATDITPALFLRITCEEEELLREHSVHHTPSTYFPPYHEHVSPVSKSLHSHTAPPPLMHFNTHPVRRSPPTASAVPRSHPPHLSSPSPTFGKCLICGHSDHRMIHCVHRQPHGCFKCGDSSHVIRICPRVFF